MRNFKFFALLGVLTLSLSSVSSSHPQGSAHRAEDALIALTDLWVCSPVTEKGFGIDPNG